MVRRAKGGSAMCGKGTNCKGSTGQRVKDPSKCSPEQIRKCHGDAKKHPCVQGKRSEVKHAER